MGLFNRKPNYPFTDTSDTNKAIKNLSLSDTLSEIALVVLNDSNDPSGGRRQFVREGREITRTVVDKAQNENARLYFACIVRICETTAQVPGIILGQKELFTFYSEEIRSSFSFGFN